MAREWVVLVDEANRELGRALKTEVHHAATPLHRAFSLFLFDRAGRTLVQRRAPGKTTWPGIWSNSCCGHPAPGEATLDAVARRCREELGAEPLGVWVALPDYRYRAEWEGMVENEICPVAVAEADPAAIAPDPDEVAGHGWLPWERLLDEVAARPEVWSPWCAEEARRLESSSEFRAWRARLAR